MCKKVEPGTLSHLGSKTNEKFVDGNTYFMFGVYKIKLELRRMTNVFIQWENHHHVESIGRAQLLGILLSSICPEFEF